MSQVCGVCGKSGAFIGGSPCGLCGIWICKNHKSQSVTINQNLAIHLLGGAPDSKQKSFVVSGSRNGSSSMNVARVCPACLSWVDYWSKDLYRIQQQTKDRYQTQQHLEQAQRFERSGRFEDAAKEYENAGAWDEAGRVRREGKAQVVKTVNVDLNRLMEDLRRGGLALNYRCHSCGGGITIGTGGMDPPKYCPYCGIMIDTKTMSDLLRTALG